MLFILHCWVIFSEFEQLEDFVIDASFDVVELVGVVTGLRRRVPSSVRVGRFWRLKKLVDEFWWLRLGMKKRG